MFFLPRRLNFIHGKNKANLFQILEKLNMIASSDSSNGNQQTGGTTTGSNTIVSRTEGAQK